MSSDTVHKVNWAKTLGEFSVLKTVQVGKELYTDLKEIIIGLDQEGYIA